MNGPAPGLRVTLEGGGNPKPLDRVAQVGIESMRMLLTAKPTEAGPRQGLLAIEALADDLRRGLPTGEQAQALFGVFLQTFAAGRMAAGMFLGAIGRALPPENRDAVLAAARAYGEIHAAPPAEGIWGTGLLAEFAECVLIDGRPDPSCLLDEVRRTRAADLLLAVRDLEQQALDAVQRKKGSDPFSGETGDIEFHPDSG
jgi:hypothetical protein